MPRKPNLAEAFNPGDELQPKPNIEVVEAKPTEKDEPQKKHIGGYFDPDVYTQMKIVCAELGITTQEFLKRGCNAVFEQHGKPPIA